MPIVPSLNGQLINDSSVSSYSSQGLIKSQGAEIILRMDRNEVSKEIQEAGGDYADKPQKSSIGVLQVDKKPQVRLASQGSYSDKQNLSQGYRRLKPPGNVSLDKSDTSRRKEGVVYHRLPFAKSAGDAEDSCVSEHTAPSALEHMVSAQYVPHRDSVQDSSVPRRFSLQDESAPQKLCLQNVPRRSSLQDEKGLRKSSWDSLVSSSRSVLDSRNRTLSEPAPTVVMSVLKSKDPKARVRDITRERKVSVTEPHESETSDAVNDVFEGDSRENNDECDSLDVREDSDRDSAKHPILKSEDGKAANSGTPLVKRRISFPADSVLTAVIQDGDTPELLRILSGRQGPGVVGGGRGVDVCQANHVGLTALHHAVLADNLDAAKLLLCHGANPNAQDVHGFSPLHTAAACGYLPITSLLLVFGADVFSSTHENELPIDVAKDLHIIRVLSAEMTRLVHEELWVTSLLKARAEQAWLLVRKLIACLLLFILHVIACIRAAYIHSRSERRKSD